MPFLINIRLKRFFVQVIRPFYVLICPIQTGLERMTRDNPRIVGKVTGTLSDQVLVVGAVPTTRSHSLKFKSHKTDSELKLI